MKYVGIIQSTNFSDKEEYIILTAANPIHMRKIPSGGENPKFITGFIKNKSYDHPLIITFSTARREAQTVRINPMTEVNFVHQPCDDFTVRGGSQSESFAYFDYSFRCIQSESELESNQILLDSRLTRTPLDLEVEIQNNTFLEELKGDLSSSPIIFKVPFQAYEEIAIKSIVISTTNFISGVTNLGAAEIHQDWYYSNPDERYSVVSSELVQVRLNVDINSAQTNKKPIVAKRFMSRSGYYSIIIFPQLFTTSDEFIISVKYSKTTTD